MLTSKQYGQLLREAERMESLCRGNELESPFVVLMRICRDYVTMSGVQMLDEDARVKYLAGRLAKFKTKYFEKI